MAERAYVVQKTQIGVETTPGTLVAATKRLQSVSWEVEPQDTTQTFRPLGSKYESIVALQREWSQIAIRGYPSFPDMTYLLSSLMSTPTVSAIMDGGTPTGGYLWTFDSANDVEDNPKTFSIEQGSAVRAMRFGNGIVRTMGLKFNRQTVELTGQALATRVEDGITMTPGATDVELQPMLASNFDMFVDPTFGGLGTTKLGRLFDGTLAYDNKYGAIWPVDSAQDSFAGTVETAPTLTFTAIMEADAAGMGYLDTLRRGDTVFGRIRNIGPEIYNLGTFVASPLHYQMTIDIALKVHNIGRFSDQEGVYAVEFVFHGVEDSGWDKAIHVEIIDKTAAL